MDDFSFSYTALDEPLIVELIGKIKEHVHEYAFSSIQVGMRFPSSFTEDEKALLKKEFQYVFVQDLEVALHAQSSVDTPDLIITINFAQRMISFHLESAYLYGIYNKFSRNLAQTIYYCIQCKGNGCVKCNNTGNMGILSVQELIAAPCVNAFHAREDKFHGAGREDVDVQMLGNGREFVLELVDPKTRTVNLEELQETINTHNKGRVRVHGLSITHKKKAADLKSADHEKVYDALVECGKKIEEKKVVDLTGKEFILQQRTPTRVSSRRSDLIRERKVTIEKIKTVTEHEFSITIKAQSGTYIKEFISGDAGRTIPSLSSLLENECACEQLDVVQIIRSPAQNPQ
jgi:tRNA pseudouridine synthase 10